jgi:hypothetical protein
MNGPLADRFEPAGDVSLADELIDDLVPPEVDWRGVVRRHPLPVLAAAAALGFWLGRSRRGTAVVEALAGAVAAGLVARVGDLGVGDLGLGDED